MRPFVVDCTSDFSQLISVDTMMYHLTECVVAAAAAVVDDVFVVSLPQQGS